MLAMEQAIEEEKTAQSCRQERLALAYWMISSAHRRRPNIVIPTVAQAIDALGDVRLETKFDSLRFNAHALLEALIIGAGLVEVVILSSPDATLPNKA